MRDRDMKGSLSVGAPAASRPPVIPAPVVPPNRRPGGATHRSKPAAVAGVRSA